MESEESSSSKKSNNTIIFFVIVLLLVIAGGYYFFLQKNATVKTTHQIVNASPTPSLSQPLHASDAGQMKMDMQKVTPVPLTAQQKKQLDSGTSTSTTEKTFNLTGGNFYFTPNKLTVNKGDKVTIIFTSNGGIHDFVIDEFNAKTNIVNTGKSATVSFVADKAGTFQFYCSVGQHRQLGMVGTLIVQ
jgi:nitrite reductase (NO-forming)